MFTLPEFLELVWFVVVVVTEEYKMFVGNFFSNMSDVDKWKFHQMKKFCMSTDTIKKVKRQPIEREKIFANIDPIRDLYTENT